MKRGRSEYDKIRKKRWIDYEASVDIQYRRVYWLLKRSAWQDRSFVGVVTHHDLVRQEEILRANNVPKQHFLYMGHVFTGRVAVSITYTCRNGHRHTSRFWSNSIEDLYERISSSELRLPPSGPSTPLDRADSIFFGSEIKSVAHDAIVTWGLCAKSLGVVRDVAQYIAHMLWQDKKCWIP